jgi:hypothetical protein
MSTSQIQATVDNIAAQQVDNEFGTARYALLFKPGVYGSVATPLTFQVGYYTQVAGLGASPGDVVINGHIDVYNRCFTASNCVGLLNFWRSLSNLTINITGLNGCRASGDFWAVGKGSPLRRVNITGNNLTLMDYCTAGPQFVTGSFIADSQTGFVINGAQEETFVRNSNIGGWSNGVWNQVFSGVIGAPAQCFPSSVCGPYTTLATSPVTREAPYLYTDSNGNYNVFVPAVQTNTSGATWTGGATPGSSIPISAFFVATPADSVARINFALYTGMNLILTPGIYHLNGSLVINRPDTIVLGLGFPTLVPQNGLVPMQVVPTRGVSLNGLIFDAGTTNSSTLLQVGCCSLGTPDESSDPTALHDVFFRIGGATPGTATKSLVVNSNNVILDDVWAWRADHGNGVGWTSNTADTGVVVNGNNVISYGLTVDHYQKFEVTWNGRNGQVIFFNNELPFDPPSQAAWMEAPGIDGFAALKANSIATGFMGYGMISHSFFNLGVNVFAANAFEVPSTLPAGSVHDLSTIFEAGSGGILNVINNTGGPATSAHPDSLVTVVSYP